MAILNGWLKEMASTSRVARRMEITSDAKKDAKVAGGKYRMVPAVDEHGRSRWVPRDAEWPLDADNDISESGARESLKKVGTDGKEIASGGSGGKPGELPGKGGSAEGKAR